MGPSIDRGPATYRKEPKGKPVLMWLKELERILMSDPKGFRPIFGASQ
jgi:hypothetical protein